MCGVRDELEKMFDETSGAANMVQCSACGMLTQQNRVKVDPKEETSSMM